jgi:hypothetical protein
MPIKTSVFLFLLFFSSVVAQVEQGTGLEVENYREVGVVVEPLGPGAASIGLTLERIESRTELRLRGAGLTLVDLSPDLDGFLYVNVNIVGNAFSILIGFERLVNYQVNDQVYLTSARTWTGGGAGTHGGSVTFLLDNIDEFLERFLIEYLRVNQ